MNAPLAIIDIAEAARLVNFGLRVKLRPARDATYAQLIKRFLDDPHFADTVRAVCQGLDLVVMAVDAPTGLVLASTSGSVFELSPAEYARRAKDTGPSHNRVLHALAHLGIAALAYPRPADLADSSYVGRISEEGVELFLRQATKRMAERAAEAGEDTDPPADAPNLEATWRVYARRVANPSTKDGRAHSASTQGIVTKAIGFLADQNLLTPAGDGVFKTTERDRVHVREAGARMFEDLLDLGITEISSGQGTLTTLTWTPEDVALL